MSYSIIDLTISLFSVALFLKPSILVDYNSIEGYIRVGVSLFGERRMVQMRSIFALSELENNSLRCPRGSTVHLSQTWMA